MKFPLSPEDVKDEIILCAKNQNSKQRLEQFLKILPKVPDEIIVNGIILIFSSEEKIEDYRILEASGNILKERNPKSNQKLESILPLVLKNWNLSIRELPFWMKRNYEIDIVEQELEKMEALGLSEIQQKKIDIIRYWLDRA